jgi:hypothetical protein
MPPHNTEPFRAISSSLSQSLKQAFDTVCPERYGEPLTLERLDVLPDASRVSFRITGGIPFALDLHITVSHVGGNVYDLATQVEDGPVRSFTYSTPAPSSSSLSLGSCFGEKIARHLLREVEQQLGKTLLREEMMLKA